MLDNIFISVIIPVYNGEKYIGNCLNSVLAQDFKKPIEILMIDDASNDNSIEEINKYNIPFLNLHSLSLNRGPSAARNLGIKSAKGKYIIFMGDDDKFIPKTLKKFISFLELNKDKSYILRSYQVEYSDNSIENFQYLPKNQVLKAGENTVAWLFKRSVTLSGFTISREEALRFSTSDVDGTLLYQVYLMAQVCMTNNSIYFKLPFVQSAQSYRKDKPMFGNSDLEKNRYTPGIVSEDNSINFTKSYFELTNYLDQKNGTNLSKLVLVDLSKYSYPFLSIQRKRGIIKFIRYANRLEKEIDFGCTLYFHIYKWSLVLFGEYICDKIILFIKFVFRYTPKL